MAIKSLPVWSLSLGCPKNRVDTERLLGSLGLPVKTVSHVGKSRLVFINTCAFIEPAVRESIRAILDVAEAIKALKRKPLLAVAGCLPGRYGLSELIKNLPEVDLWLHTKSQKQWPALIMRRLNMPGEPADGRLLSTGPSYAWLKISEGCRHQCAFCTIPSIRGKFHSEKPESIVAEARHLLASGIKELVLVGQDVTAWGQDFNMNDSGLQSSDLCGLLCDLSRLDGLAWLRLLYLYPDSISDELLRTMAHTGRPVLPYLDIPFQHSEKKILSSMGRPFKNDPRRLLDRIHAFLPGAALRTTFIVGYPGETEGDFDALCQFVKEARFQNMGVFTYYAEEGTKAAELPGQLPEHVKKERRDYLMSLQAQISRELLIENTGKKMDVLVDKACHEEWPGLHLGRVWFQAPEIDGVTYVSGPGVEAGKLLQCEIEEAHDYDLVALSELAEE